MVYSSHLWYVVGIVHNWVYRWPFTTHPHSWVFLDIYPEQDREVSAPEASQIMKLHNYCTYNWWLWLYNLFWWFYNLFWLAQLAHWNFHVGIAMDGTCLQNILLPQWSLGIIMQFMAISIEHYMKTWNHQGDNENDWNYSSSYCCWHPRGSRQSSDPLPTRVPRCCLASSEPCSSTVFRRRLSWPSMSMLVMPVMLIVVNQREMRHWMPDIMATLRYPAQKNKVAA